MKSQKITFPIPVRLDEKTRNRLKSAAQRMGATTSAVMRFAVINQLRQIETGVVILADN